jgi:cation diffusion facilitator family transporter
MKPAAQQARQITVAGFAINFLLAGFKFAVGFFGRSQAVMADGVHSLSDMVTDLFILIGIKFWSAPADECHPYGHQRIETITTVGIASLLAFAAAGLGWRAVHQLADPVCPPLSYVFIAPLISIIVKEILFRRTREVGRRIHSPAVMANAWHHRSDVISSIPPLVAVVAAAINPKWAFLDAVGALVVALLILRVAWKIAAPALAELTERGASPQELQIIEALACAVSGVCSVHKIRTRRLGAGLFIDLHVVVDGDLTVRASHEIASAMQKALIDNGPAVADVTVHVEPDDK